MEQFNIIKITYSVTEAIVVMKHAYSSYMFYFCLKSEVNISWSPISNGDTQNFDGEISVRFLCGKSCQPICQRNSKKNTLTWETKFLLPVAFSLVRAWCLFIGHFFVAFTVESNSMFNTIFYEMARVLKKISQFAHLLDSLEGNEVSIYKECISRQCNHCFSWQWFHAGVPGVESTSISTTLRTLTIDKEFMHTMCLCVWVFMWPRGITIGCIVCEVFYKASTQVLIYFMMI